jgi:hypothetical protein
MRTERNFPSQSSRRTSKSMNIIKKRKKPTIASIYVEIWATHNGQALGGPDRLILHDLMSGLIYDFGGNLSQMEQMFKLS